MSNAILEGAVISEVGNAIAWDENDYQGMVKIARAAGLITRAVKKDELRAVVASYNASIETGALSVETGTTVEIETETAINTGEYVDAEPAADDESAIAAALSEAAEDDWANDFAEAEQRKVERKAKQRARLTDEEKAARKAERAAARVDNKRLKRFYDFAETPDRVRAVRRGTLNATLLQYLWEKGAVTLPGKDADHSELTAFDRGLLQQTCRNLCTVGYGMIRSGDVISIVKPEGMVEPKLN